MSSYLGTDDDSVMSILELSYNDLPSHLKSCFLCLSFFKEDAVIRARDLTLIWIAEGFIPQETIGEEMTMEETARSYLDELINRNIIQVKEYGKASIEILSCQVHDLLHDLSIRKAIEEINFREFTELTDSNSLDKHRHCVVHYNRERIVSSKINSHLRSLFLYGRDRMVSAISSRFWKNFEILRVLKLEGCVLKTLPESICTLIALRYLGLQHTRLDELPESLGRLKNLQVLDLKGCWYLVVPNIIWQLKSLRHLFMPLDIVCREPLKLDTLKKLQTLSTVVTSKIVVDHLLELPSLRKLNIVVDVDPSKLGALMGKLTNVVSIKIVSPQYYFPLDGLGSLQFLTILKLGRKFEWIKFPFLPQNLSCVTLIQTSFSNDPIPVLELLPNLVYLRLERERCIRDTLIENIVISQGGFPELSELFLQSSSLRTIQIGDGGMPKLKRLIIEHYGKVRILPEKERERLFSNLQKFSHPWGKNGIM